MANKIAGIIYLLVGFSLAPVIIGIPIMILGIWHLTRKN